MFGNDCFPEEFTTLRNTALADPDEILREFDAAGVRCSLVHTTSLLQSANGLKWKSVLKRANQHFLKEHLSNEVLKQW